MTGHVCTTICRLRAALTGIDPHTDPVVATRVADDALSAMLIVSVEMLSQCPDDLATAYVRALVGERDLMRSHSLLTAEVAGHA